MFGAIFRHLSESASKAASDVGTWTIEQIEAGYREAMEKGKGAFADGVGWTMASKIKVGSYKDMVADAVKASFGKKERRKRARASNSTVPCPVDEVSRKAETRERRRQLVEKGKGSSDPKVHAAAKELENDMDAIEDAKLANHIYCVHDISECDRDNSEVPGFKDVSKDQMTLNKLGLRSEELKSSTSNFRAAVFRKETPPFSTEEAGYVVVFKGTSPTNLEDWRNNFRQGIDADSEYYKNAVRIGGKVGEAVGTSDFKVTFTGHSLGGGLASAAAISAGLPANTFNAAGLNDATVNRYGGELHSSEVHAYSVPGDPLTETNLNGVKILGMTISRPPVAAGTPDRVPRALEDQVIPKGKDDSYFHSMAVVIRAMERRKGANEERLCVEVE